MSTITLDLTELHELLLRVLDERPPAPFAETIAQLRDGFLPGDDHRARCASPGLLRWLETSQASTPLEGFLAGLQLAMELTVHTPDEESQLLVAQALDAGAVE